MSARRLGTLARVLMCLLATMLIVAGEARADDKDITALENVTIIDVQSGEVRPAQTIVWQRSRILAADSSKNVKVPASAQRIDGGGRFVIPGLWDMHVHVGRVADDAEDLSLPLFIANGVTTVRDMSDYMNGPDYRYSGAVATKRWDAEARAGLRVGPRVIATASIVVDGPWLVRNHPELPAFYSAATPDDAREVVRYIKDETVVDAIKVYSGIPRASYFALMDEAHKLGVTVIGHKPLAVSFLEAVNAGQRSIEHAREILLDTYPGAAQLQQDAERLRPKPTEREQLPPVLKQVMAQHDPKALKAIFDAMIKHDTYYVPTHVTRLFDWKSVANDRAYLDDPRMKLLHPHAEARALKDVEETRSRASGADDAAVYQAFFEKGLQVTRQAYEAGVNVMAGTDTGDSYCFPGSSLLDELGWIASSGLKPIDVLRMAIITPPRYAGRSADFGGIAAGKVADLVLLDRNPLADIGNLHSIQTVVFNGRVFDRAALDGILSGVGRKAQSLREGAAATAPASAASGPASGSAAGPAPGSGLPPPPILERRTVASLGLELEPILPGHFVMGSPTDEPAHEPDESPQTEVTITKPFWLGRTEVTHGQWRALMGTTLKTMARAAIADKKLYDDGGGNEGTIAQFNGLKVNPTAEALLTDTSDDVPMHLVNWNDAMAFCEKLNERERAAHRLPEGYVYRLPTDAEWEYAARAGSTGAIYRGTLKILGKSNAPALDPIAWYAGNSAVGFAGHGIDLSYRSERQYPQPTLAGPRHVGLKQPNDWGLYDMIGNVWEWAMDWYEISLPGGSVVDPKGPASGTRRVVRGGGWNNPVRDVRSAQRYGVTPVGGRLTNLGFRVALAPELP